VVGQVTLQSDEIGEGTLRRHEAQLHQPAGRIIDEERLTFLLCSGRTIELYAYKTCGLIRRY
jgi:hypothetical protein